MIQVIRGSADIETNARSNAAEDVPRSTERQRRGGKPLGLPLVFCSEVTACKTKDHTKEQRESPERALNAL